MRKILAVFLVLFILPFSAHAASSFNPLCSEYDSNGVCSKGPCAKDTLAANSATCQDNQKQHQDATNSNPVAGKNGVLQKVANFIAVLTGIFGVLVIIVAGITFITAGGLPGSANSGDNPNKVKKARGMIVSALTGMVVVGLAWSIVTFAVQRFIK